MVNGTDASLSLINLSLNCLYSNEGNKAAQPKIFGSA